MELQLISTKKLVIDSNMLERYTNLSLWFLLYKATHKNNSIHMNASYAISL